MASRKFRRRYRRARARATNKRIAKIAKSVVVRTMETKHFSATQNTNWYDGDCSANNAIWWNPFYNLQAGTSDNNITGDALLIKAMKAKIYMGYNSSKSNSPAYFRVALVTTDQAIPNGTFGGPGVNYNYGWMFQQMTAPYFLARFNTKVVTVLKEKVFKIEGNAGTSPYRVVSFDKLFKKGVKQEFQEQTQTAGSDKLGKKRNYYYVLDFFQPNSAFGPNYSGYAKIQYQIDYKDI